MGAIVALILAEPFPGCGPVGLALGVGAFIFGGWLVLFISALRSMGAARAGAVYAAAPFVGCIVSLVVFSDEIQTGFWVALPLFLAGAFLIIQDQWSESSGC